MVSSFCFNGIIDLCLQILASKFVKLGDRYI